MKTNLCTRRSVLRLATAGLAVNAGFVRAQATKSPEEPVIEEIGVTTDGKPLVLNGMVTRKQGYLKSDVTGLYLPQRLSSPEAIFRLDGPRRIKISMLRSFSETAITRFFISDMETAATPAEFKQLILVVAEIGEVYSKLAGVKKGDVTHADWVPGSGIVVTFNGKPMLRAPINNELAYQVYLRMFIGPKVPASTRNALLGLAPSAT